jgi:hypothetical protein
VTSATRPVAGLSYTEIGSGFVGGRMPYAISSSNAPQVAN